MSEIVRDMKYTNIELTSDLGLTFSGANPRLKHTGTGTFTIESTVGKINLVTGSDASDSLNIDSSGGIDIDGVGQISIETTDTTNGITIAETTDVPIDIGAGGGTFLLGKLGETAQFRGSLTVTGDLTVNGDSVTHNVIINETEDPVMRLNKNASGTNTVDIGFVGDRGDDTNIGWIWDESADEFSSVFISDDAQLNLTGSTQNTVFTDYANIHAGTGTLDDDLYVGTNKFSVIGASGNTTVNAGTLTVSSTTDSANAISLSTNGGTSETILIQNNQGTAAGSIIIDSEDGGIQITTSTNNPISIENNGTVGINMTNPNDTYALDVNGTANATSIFQANALLVPTGSVMQYAGGSAPTGWLICDGSAVSRTTYATLFAVISTTYGVGDGSTTFNLPNTQGKSVFGYNSGDTSFDALGETGGSKTTTLTTNELPAHTHTGTTDSDGAHTHSITDPGHTHALSNDEVVASGVGSTVANRDEGTGETTGSSTTGISIVSGGAHTHTFTTGSSGSGNSFSLLNPYIVFNYIIKH